MEVDINQGEVVEEMEWELLTEDPAPMEWECESDLKERRKRRALAQKKSLLHKLSVKEQEKLGVKVFLERLLMSELNLELKKPALVMVGPVQELGLEIPIKISADVRPGTFKDRDEKSVKGHVISWNITIQVVTDKEKLEADREELGRELTSYLLVMVENRLIENEMKRMSLSYIDVTNK